MAQRRIEYQNISFDISYEIVKPNLELAPNSQSLQSQDSPPIMLFLHGWGSNKDLMKIAFGKCFREFCHIYVDMPGFGNSPNEMALQTQDYAAIIQKFVYEVSRRKASECVIVGHSFGGKVATLCQPKEMILLSSAGIVVPKPFKVRFKIALTKIMGKLGLRSVGKMFRSSDVNTMNEGMYQTFKNVVDEDFSKEFSSYNGVASIFWGESDSATPLFCGEKIASLIKHNRFFAMQGDHYFFLKQGAEVERLYRSKCENK